MKIIHLILKLLQIQEMILETNAAQILQYQL